MRALPRLLAISCLAAAIGCGAAAGVPVSSTDSRQWNETLVEGASRFVKLASLELMALSPHRSKGRAVLTVTNPFSFPIAIASVRYGVSVSGKQVATGVSRGRVLRAARRSALELSFPVDHPAFLAAAGNDWAVGAELDATVALSIDFRLPAGLQPVSLELSGRMGTDGARSGPLSLPDGATSLSPR